MSDDIWMREQISMHTHKRVRKDFSVLVARSKVFLIVHQHAQMPKTYAEFLTLRASSRIAYYYKEIADVAFNAGFTTFGVVGMTDELIELGSIIDSSD